MLITTGTLIEAHMLQTTLPPWPNYSSDEARAVADVIASNRVNYWTGEECRKFEAEYAAVTFESFFNQFPFILSIAFDPLLDWLGQSLYNLLLYTT